MARGLNDLRRWIWPALGGLGIVLILLLWLSPAERTLGQIVKLVYLHGALVRTATVLFGVSLPVNLVALLKERRDWANWGKALTWTALAIWLVHTLFSMFTTYAAWGVFIAWFEPRTRFTFTLAVVGLIIAVAAHGVGSPRFSALAFVLLAGLTLVLAPQLGAVQHPINPIGQSSSDTMRVYYTAIQIVSLAIGGLLVAWLQGNVAAGGGR